MAEDSPPPVPGEWQRTQVPNTGPWTVGTVWLDRPSGRYAMLVEPRHCNALGTMNGGALATFLDGQVMAVSDRPGDGTDHTPTITLTVDYLAPPFAGDWLIAKTRLVRTTRSMIVSDVIVSVGKRVVARSNAIYSNTQGKVQQ